LLAIEDTTGVSALHELVDEPLDHR
jgi:hypothetical protein